MITFRPPGEEKTSWIKIALGGIVATIPMMALMYARPYLGFPDWPHSHMLSVSITFWPYWGCLLHLSTGILFALIYCKLGRHLAIKSYLMKGMLMGLIFYFIMAICWILMIKSKVGDEQLLPAISYPYALEYILFGVGLSVYIHLTGSGSRSNYDLIE